MTASKHDIVIVGAGSAGCVLANRLSADPDRRVLVLEAGRMDSWWDLFLHMPAALTIPIGNPHYDWRYQSEPEPNMGGRRIYHARGKVVGGSSSINGMIFQRGNPMDFEKWARAPGMQGWGYDRCLPYFKRMETCLAGGDAYRGDGGPLELERGPGTNPLFAAFLEAARQAGYPATSDVNGYQQEGFGLFDRNIRHGKRLSAARAYYHPVKDRPNLQLVTHRLGKRIVFEGRRAVAVEALDPSGRVHRYDAGEVVLCGGAFNSPQLLQLSGVGPADLLAEVGVPLVAEVPGVGANLQDHLEVYVQHACTQPVSMNPARAWWRAPWIGLQWLFGTGPAATNHFEAGGFVRSNDQVEYPNLMFHFLPLAVRYDGSEPVRGHGYQVHVGPMNSEAQGTVRIRSGDPREHPALVFNYLSAEQDRREWVEAIETARTILGQAALRPFDGGEVSPGPEVLTHDEILDWVGRDAETALHPCGTCRMGAADDPLAVTDPETFAVRGVEGVRVVDASIMPHVTNANIYAPVVMMAERAADAILGRAPLPAEEPGFYRAGDAPARVVAEGEGAAEAGGEGAA